ncbi:DUF6979 family protein [Brevibacillus sp. SYSU BS000544]|uniref:DUF6979 family protein n=1 Tax=Brevibacillus sp. SYSU BS000544 TaxID=3416443 RepID=UPI003CE46097
MNKYGQAAVMAVELLHSNHALSPQDAWQKATGELFSKSTHGQDKDCPRSAFLGLCEEGFVQGVVSGKYTGSKASKGYALKGVELLKQNPSLAKSPSTLWKAIGKGKRHNSQMDVVISLWENNLIIR